MTVLLSERSDSIQCWLIMVMSGFCEDPGLSNERSVQPRVDLVRTDFDGVRPILSGFLR